MRGRNKYGKENPKSPASGLVWRNIHDYGTAPCP